jgi:hypothetical protein
MCSHGTAPSQFGLLPRGGEDTIEVVVRKKQLQTAASGIRIVSDSGLETDKVFGRAVSLMRDAEVIIFLGFGFLKENVERLAGHGALSNAKIYGTTLGLTASEVSSNVKPQFQDLYIETAKCDALDFLRNNLTLLV